MSNFTIPDPPTYSSEMRMLEALDPAHAHIFNPLYCRLLENEEYLKQQIETQTLAFTNVSVPASDWTAEEGSEPPWYKIEISGLEGVTESMDAEVFFGPDQAKSGIFANCGEVGTGSVTLYAFKQPEADFVIPKIRFMK